MPRPSARIRLLIAGGALALVAAACTGGASEGSASSPTTDTRGPVATAAGPLAPSTPFAFFDGSRASLADFAGAPVVVNFWASWCPSCVAEMSSAFRPAQAEFGDRVTFLGMNISDDRSLAQELLTETGVQWVNAEDPVGDLYADLGGLGMPFTVLISASGEIVESHNGPLTGDQLNELITLELLG